YPELGGVGISATLGIYSMLEELYAEEVFRLFEGDKDIIPAIRRLRQRLEKGHLQLSTTDGGQIETKSLEQLSSYNRHKENFKIEFGTSGWRGVIEKDFDIHNVRRVAQAVAEYYLNYIKTGIILIGFDPRKGNRGNAMEIAAIMAANGIPVRIIETEPTPTPVLAYLANSSEEIKGVINLTASHNPYEDAGFKFSPYHGGAAEKAITTKIEDSANSITEYKVINYEEGVKEGIIEEYEVEKAIDIYVNGYIIPTIKEIGAWETIISYIKENREFKLILDPMQGTSVKYMGAIYGAMRKEVGRDFYTMIHMNNRDSEFKEVNGAPNPTESENIQELLQMMIEDPKVFKLATDGDADRFGVIDFGGKELSANEIMAMLVYFLHSKGFEGIVGKTVSTSNFVNAVAEYLDIELLEEPVGFKWFVARVINEGKQFIVAGEESAHVGIGPFMKSWDDGIAIGLMCLWMTADTGKSLTSYKEEIETTIDKKFHYKRGKVDLTASLKKKTEEFINNVKEEQKKEISLEEMEVIKVLKNLGLTQKAVSVITVDGLKVVFKSGDWFCIRLSGTQFVSRLYTEVTDINREEGLVILGNKLFEDIDGQDGGTFIQTIGNMSEQGAAIIVAVDATYKNEVNFDGGKVRLANRPILQVKIDVSNLTEAVKTAKEAVRGGADWIEMSAGLNLSETIKTIQRLKNEFPETKVSVDFDVVTVDMPMVDVVTEVIEAGADIISVYEDLIRQDRIITMIDKVKEFKENGRDIKLRVNFSRWPEESLEEVPHIAKWLEAIGADYVSWHALPEQRENLDFDLIQKIIEHLSIPLAITRGLNEKNVSRAIKTGARIVSLDVKDDKDACLIVTNTNKIIKKMDMPSLPTKPTSADEICKTVKIQANHIRKVAASLDSKKTEEFLKKLISSKVLFIVAAGRSALAAKYAKKWLSKTGLDVRVIDLGDQDVPLNAGKREGDMAVAISSSGNTESIVDYV
ncbi:MAG: hypothetical protein KAI91_02355, partial [Candidatus Omnitrophica bacterium]|nr:hypothetical protein [Candidatus Omnitrophota bacterium]